jgi:hypothetical protein
MPRAAPAGAYPAARLIFCRPQRRVDGRENGAFIKTRAGSRYVGGPVGLAEIYRQNGGDRNPLPRSRPGQDSILLTALSSQPKTLRWAENGVGLTERGELLGADAGSHSNRFPLQRRC